MGKIAYRALATQLRDAIRAGEYSPDRQLPTEDELSRSTGLSRQTVRRALQELVAEGLVYRVRGRGTFPSVASRAQYLRSIGSLEDLLALSLDTVLETLTPLHTKINVEAASRLQLPSDEVMTASFRRTYADAPFSVSQVFLPVSIGMKLREAGVLSEVGHRSPTTLISQLGDVLPRPIAVAHQSINAIAIEAEWAQYLDLEPGVPTLRIDRVYLDTTGAPVELGISRFNPERYSYRLELRRAIQP
jgi:GntR family transcriptional regulator